MLIVSAEVVIRGAPPLLSGTLSGALLIANRPTYPFGPPYQSICTGGHGFEMMRR